MTEALVLDHRSSLDDLASDIIATAGRLSAATCQWLLLVADFDARDGCHQFGLGTTSHWLAHTCGLAQRTAEEHVRVARTLLAHPHLAESMSAGRLSFSHARAISRIVHEGETELLEELVHSAEQGTVRHLEVLVRGLRTVRQLADDDAPPPEEYVKQSWSPIGQQRLTARFAPERGAVVESAITAVAKAEGLSRPDALLRLAEIGLAAVADANKVATAPEDTAPDETTQDSVRPVARTLRGEEQAVIIVHVDATALR